MLILEKKKKHGSESDPWVICKRAEQSKSRLFEQVNKDTVST